ncbi:MAG: DsrE/DsrF-like family protein [Methanomassiliicoccales archaeon PtaU1.Bin124]|nr:MAG: DsrE/DsrF-like family protein [Methanomassiliicoccales archaeon PtaU1.Bin124]
MKTLVIQLRTGTMMNMDSNVAVKLAQAAVEKGYDVRIFGYGEGIMLVKDGQEPKRFPNVGAETKELVEKKHVEVAVCNTCCAARGLRRGEEIPGMKVGSLTNDLSRYVAESAKMVTIAR